MSKQKVRVVKDDMKQGIDTCCFELTLTGQDLKDLHEQSLYNPNGMPYGSVKAHNGKATIIINLPQFVRKNNLKPFSIHESIWLEILRNQCILELREIFGSNMNTKITRIEANITQKVSGVATQSDVLNLLSHATLNHGVDNVKYVGPNMRRSKGLEEENHTVITKKPHYWIGKFYDKTAESIKKCVEQGQPADDVPLGLLRIEIVMIDRTLNNLFGSRKTLSDILTAQSFLKILREYKRIYCSELVDEKIKPYLKACQKQLIKYLLETDNPEKTVATHREIIPDAEVLHKALTKYQKLRNKTNNAARDTKRYVDQYSIPCDCIMTIRDFKKACG